MSMGMAPAEIRVLSVTESGEAAGNTLETRFDRFIVATAAGAAEGLDRLQAGAFDCVLSEYKMSHTDGIDFLRAVREVDTELPFVLHTDSGSEAVASEAISAGVTDYVRREDQGQGQSQGAPEQWARLADRITEAVSTQQTAAGRPRQRLEQTLKTVPACIVQLSPDGEFTFANERATEVLGIDRAELIGRTYNDPGWAITDTAGNPIPDEELPFRQVRETGEPIEDVRQTITLPDGTEKLISVNGTPLEDGTGALRSVLFAITDMTDRYERQQTLTRQNDLSRKAQAVADVGAWEYDVAADSLHWSEQVYEIHDLEQAADVQIADAIEFYHPEDRATIQEALTAAVDAGESYEIEARLITAEGAERWVRTSADPQTESGSVVRLRGTIQDITASKTRERELQQQRDRYQSLFENNPLIIWEEDFSAAAAYVADIAAEVDDVERYLLDHDEEIAAIRDRIEVIDVNQNAVDAYDAPSKEALIENLEEIVMSEADEIVAAEWAAIADGATRFRAETTAQTLSGEQRTELLDLFVPAENADDYSRVYVIGTDISEQKQREQALKRQNERLDKFTSIVSHDLRNPLNVATARLELATDECDSPSPHLDDIRAAHDRMEQLIDDLLRFARAGQDAIEHDHVDLRRLVREFRATGTTDEAAVVVETDRTIRADRDRVRQLIENLIQNGFDHGGAGVTVTVGDCEGGFYVEDDGPGVPPASRETIFEPGYSSTTNGTGFGLSIVKQVVGAHGWEIQLVNGADGGARFEITGVEPAA